MTPKEYELHVAQMIEEGINNGDHGLDPKLSVVNREPEYFSRDRQSAIKFDAAVEVTRPGTDDPFFYWVIECKHYSHNVPVDDAEEFYAKLQQVGGANSKGTIVTKTGFASGTVAYCQSKGIGLWRYDPDGENAMVVQADDLRTRAILSGLTECSFQPKFFGLATNGYASNIQENMIACELWLLSEK